ncbi:hypothetical protein GCM10027051_23640 [Niabella terrae]
MVFKCRLLQLSVIFILSGCFLAAKAQSVPELGVCASISQANLVKKYGYDFIKRAAKPKSL